ncbi:MAG: transporter substrate-binding domain-containing protein [Alkalimonas sp.]|nr:transporter substrate-binding domain-containing protein [Alkalimonas sp.]
MLFKIKVTWLLVFLLLPSSALAQSAELIWCLGHLPNRSYYVDGQNPQGIEVEMMQDVAARLNMQLVYTVPTPTNRCLQQLIRDEVDIVAGLLSTTEREQQFLMIPYDEARPESWFIHRDNPIDEKASLRITFIEGRVYSATLRESYQTAGHHVSSSASIDDALALLLFRQTDVVVGPEHITLGQIAANPRYQQTLVLAPQDYQPSFEAHIALSRTGRYADRYQAFREVIEQIRAEGKYQFY